MISFVALFVVLSTSTVLVNSQFGYGAPPVEFPEVVFNPGFQKPARDPLELLAINIPGGGVPGLDYPILASIPDTGFSCSENSYPGYYADVSQESFCQVFHICQFDGRHDSFLCPNGTMYNQQLFVCDWWFNVDCSSQNDYYYLNAEIGKVPEPSIPNDEVLDFHQYYSEPQGPIQNSPSSSYNTPSLGVPLPGSPGSPGSPAQQSPSKSYRNSNRG